MNVNFILYLKFKPYIAILVNHILFKIVKIYFFIFSKYNFIYKHNYNIV